MKNVSGKSCRGTRNIRLCSITYFRKSCRLLDDVKKCRIVRQVTEDNMAHSHCIPKATNTHTHTHTHTGCVIFIAFSLKKGCTKAPQC